MKKIFLNQDTTLCGESVATIGFFDGVHRGHQYLIRQVTDESRRLGLSSMAITFDRHPRQVVQSSWQPELLSTLTTKTILLSRTEIDETVVLPFNQTMAAMSAEQFMAEVLKKQLGVRKLIIGYDHRFGHNRTEGFDEYVLFGKKLGIDVVQSLPLDVDGVRVSSSAIRQLVKDGNIAEANRCLGHRYTLDGTVEHGFQEGRKLGFPTANLNVDGTFQLVPRPGVYAVWVRPEGQMQMYRAMMNIGHRPTFGGHSLTLEVNIFNFKENLYGKQMLVSFEERIREERLFDSPEELARQLQEDKETVGQILKHNE